MYLRIQESRDFRASVEFELSILELKLRKRTVFRIKQ